MKVYAIVSGYYPEKIHHLYDPMYTTKEPAIKMLHEICDALNLRKKQRLEEDIGYNGFDYYVDEEKMYVYHIANIETSYRHTESFDIPCAWVETRELL